MAPLNLHKSILFFVIGFFACLSIIGQDSKIWVDSRFVKDYSPLYSNNDIPSEFSIPTIDQCLQEIAIMRDSLTDLTSKQKKSFILTNNYYAERLFRSGAILFGDSVSLYINKIAKKILEPYPNLLKKIRFYAFKSSTTNAFTTSKGAIYINIGLISRLKNEAELAFILGHEIAHYIQNHSYQSYVDTYSMQKKAGKYSSKSYGRRLSLKFKFEKNQEFEADSIGLILFSKAKYKVESSTRAMNLLYYDYLPFEEIKFNQTCFNSGSFVIPKKYFPESVKEIPPIEARNEKYHTHPNIARRIAKLDSIIDLLNLSKGKKFFNTKNKFLKIRETCRFETIWLNLLKANYPDAIYDSYVMLQKYPNNNFLKIAIARGLYGIAKYKNEDQLHLVAKRYSTIQGQSEALHFMIKHLSKDQFSTLTLRYLLDHEKIFRDRENYSTLRDDLIRDMVVKNELKIDTFQKKKRKKHNDKYFHLSGLPELVNDKEIINTFRSFYPELEKKKEDFRITYKEKQKREKKKQKDIDKNGYRINANSIILLDPSCFYVTFRKKINYFKAHSAEKFVLNYVSKSGQKNGIKVIPTSSININNDFNYNMFSLLQFWYNENTIHSEVNIIPLYSNELMKQFKKLKAKYVYKVDLYNFKKKGYYSYFESTLVELSTGKMVYSRKESTKHSYTEAEIKTLINSDLININR